MTSDRVVPAPARPDLLRVYLNDHLTGATGGLALARRLAGSHQGTAADAELVDLAEQVEADRDALLQVMQELGISRALYKEPVAVLAERLGRLKLNGTLVHRSPLSTVIELEAMTLAVTGKLAGWRALRTLSGSEPRLDPARLERLITRAEVQLATLEQLRTRAVTEALSA